MMTQLSDEVVEIGDVLDALARVIDATNEHDRARDSYGGYSWGWHGSALIHERDKARQDLAERLNAYIDGRIATAIAAYEAKGDIPLDEG